MIGMNSLGKNGRLGNQLFQYAALVGIAKNRGFDFCIPDHSKATVFEDSTGRAMNHHLQNCFKMSHLNGRYGFVDGDTVELHQHEFCEELFNECPDDVTLHGHFESYKYFENVESELREDLEFRDEILEAGKKFHTDNNLQNAVSITVRRGDFLLYSDCHPVCDANYYNDCITKLGEDRQYVVISDDVEWCKTQEVFSGKNFYFVDSTPNGILKQYNDMCVGSMCDDFIISNSTFAWWASWMGKSKTKKVYIPDPWFGPTYGDWNTDGFYPDYSVKIAREIGK